VNRKRAKQAEKGEKEENKIIKKKWKTEATTQAEMRDCQLELTGE